jgi:hypothetical protein
MFDFELTKILLYILAGSHPSRLGAYACGATIATAMTGDDPMLHECYPTTDDPIYESEGTAVRAAVAKTIIDTFNSGLIRYPFDTLWTTAAPTGAPTPATDPPVTPAPSAMPSADPSYQPTAVGPMDSTTPITESVVTASAATTSPTNPSTPTTSSTTTMMVAAVDRTPSDAMPSLSQGENSQGMPVGLASGEDGAMCITGTSSSRNSRNGTRLAALNCLLQLGALVFLLHA